MLYFRPVIRLLNRCAGAGPNDPSHTLADPAVHGARRTRRVDRREL